MNQEDPYNLSIPLKELYILLSDMYIDYPIKFMDFRYYFEKYMKLTNKQLIDAIILLIYGATDIKQIGTGEEDMIVTENDKEMIHKSPFYRFIQDNKEIRIGYNYATILDYSPGEKTKKDDERNPEEKQKELEHEEILEEIAEENTDKKRFRIKKFDIYIDLENKIISWVYNYPKRNSNENTEKRIYNINLVNKNLIMLKNHPLYDVSDGTIIETQPVPKELVAVKSYKKNNKIITVLNDENQFVYLPNKLCFEIISKPSNEELEKTNENPEKIYYNCERHYIYM